MPWTGRARQQQLPPNWPALRRRILHRDGHRCTLIVDTRHRLRCPQPATDVDHIKPGDDHSEQNLRSLCRDHHAAKSSAEGHQARGQGPLRRRPAEKHPGLNV